MKKYSVVHKLTGIELAASDDLSSAVRVTKSLGADFTTLTWVGFGGLPAAACVMRDDGQLETICLYSPMAQDICNIKNGNEHDPHSYHVVQVILNTGLPQGFGV